MKQFFFLLALALITNYTLSQKYQEAGYKSYEELKNNSPAYPVSFEVTKRYESKPDLKVEFEKETDKSNGAILLKYLIKVNDQEK